MQFLINKTVFILSPVKWGKMRVSKHHYAIELAQAGNCVYFIEPPDITLKKGFVISESGEYKNLFLVSYKPVARGQRFSPAFLYRQLLRIQVQLLLKQVKKKPDLVISFDPCRFENLKWFGAEKTLFFAADLYLSSSVPGEVGTADICLGVSPTIVNLLNKNNPASYYINHGVNAVFVEMAKRQKKQMTLFKGLVPSKAQTAGYIGNLLIGSLDRETMRRVIISHPKITFIFWGQYDRGQDNMVAHEAKEVWDFIDFLKESANVILRGPKNQEELALEILQADFFWVCYDLHVSWQVDGSNSHKILEYLATGRPVIANHTLAYNHTDLIYMLQENNNSSYCSLFDKTVEQIKFGEKEELINSRLDFALANAYSRHIELIDSLLSGNHRLEQKN